MFQIDIVPDASHFWWLFIFGAGVMVTGVLLKHWQPRGFAWWIRLPVLFTCLFTGHVVQTMTGLRGLPGLVDIWLFPAMPGALANMYGNLPAHTGMDWRESMDSGAGWGLAHGGLVWFIVGAMLFASFRMRRVKRILYGDDPPGCTGQ